MSPSASPLSRTRRSLHGVAELVLAGPQHRRSGTIRLRVAPGGFATTAEPRLAVDAGVLVVGDARVSIDGRSCAELAAAAGGDARTPEAVYDGGSGVAPGEVLTVDALASARLAEAFAAGQEALRRFAPAATPVLWPEHFDLAIALDGVNYGVSPGDEHLDEPYAYVGPWQPRPGDGGHDGGHTNFWDAEFWNAPFGAARPLGPATGVAPGVAPGVLADVAAMVAFFTHGRDLARS